MPPSKETIIGISIAKNFSAEEANLPGISNFQQNFL
jgi:hypothetical protein